MSYKPTEFEIMTNCRQFLKISKILATYALASNYTDEIERYKYVLNFAGIHIPRKTTMTENKLIPQLGDSVVELLVQYENLYRYFPDIHLIKGDLNFDFLHGLNSKSLIYAQSRIEYNKRYFYLDEHNYPKNGDYYNDYVLAALYSSLSTRFYIFLDNFEYLDHVPPRNVVPIWNNATSEYFKVFSAKEFFNNEEFLQRRNLLLTCF